MQSLLDHFGVNWKLLLAQAVNFAILVFVLKRFAYRPVMDLMNKRKKKVEEGIRMHQEAQEELKNADIMKEQKLQAAQKEGVAIVTQAEKLAKEKQGQMIIEATQKAEGIVADTKRIIDQERTKMNDAVYQGATELVKAGIMKVLGKAMDDKNQDKLISEALAELKTVPLETKHTK